MEQRGTGMSRPNPIILFVVLAAVAAALGGAAIAKGGFFIAKHEGDTLHLLQIVLRMAEGEWPHLDFMTPIGILAFWPISVLVERGFGIGQAILWSQVGVAAALLLPTYWAALTRFKGALGYLFGASVMVLTMALVHGEADQLVSVSMHYNRWAWAVAYIVVILAVLPAQRASSGLVDGLIIGLGVAALALCKATYVIALAPGILVALMLRRAWPTVLFACLAGFAVIVVMTLAASTEFWPAYLGDLAAVAGSEVRPQPGFSLQNIISAPAYIGGSFALVAGVILLRQTDEPDLGLVLLLLAPGFVYITFQNFGNDPQWLVLAALLLLVARPGAEAKTKRGWPLAQTLSYVAVAMLAFATPSMLNLAYSPFRHLNADPEDYTPMLAASAQHSDLHTRLVRANRVDGAIGLDGPGSGLEDRREAALREDGEVTLNGEALFECELQLGLIAWLEVITEDLTANGYQGAKIFAADIFNSHWLFGGVKRLPNGSPWYYGGLPGFEAADYVLVPICPASQGIRKMILDRIEEEGITLTEVHRSPHYILLEPAAGSAESSEPEIEG